MHEIVYFFDDNDVLAAVIAPNVLTPRFVPAVILTEVSTLITKGNLTTPKTNPTIPPTNPIARPDKARTRK